MTTHLILQGGTQTVTRRELQTIEAPPATATWFPVKHSAVIDTVEEALTAAGFQIRAQQLALARGHARLFATLDLVTPLATDVTLAVGIRNSLDKSLPLGFCAGSRVLVCSNLAFRAQLLVSRKHTRFGQERFAEAICQAVQSLQQFQEVESERIRKFQHTELTANEADALLLRAYEQQIISAPLLSRVLREWREPSFAEFQPRTLWSLFNAFTTILAERQRSNPQQFAAQTIRLQQFLTTDENPDEPLAA